MPRGDPRKKRHNFNSPYQSERIFPLFSSQYVRNRRTGPSNWASLRFLSISWSIRKLQSKSLGCGWCPNNSEEHGKNLRAVVYLGQDNWTTALGTSLWGRGEQKTNLCHSRCAVVPVAQWQPEIAAVWCSAASLCFCLRARSIHEAGQKIPS